MTRRTRLPLGMALPTLGLVVVGLALTVFAGPLFGLSQRAAAELRDPGVYITSVVNAPTEHEIDVRSEQRAETSDSRTTGGSP